MGNQGAGKTKPKPRILLVEDVDDVRSVFALILSSQGFDVMDFGTSEEALDFCSQQLPDAALIDADLNGDDGMILGKFIREQTGGENVVLATLTGNESQSCRDKAIEFGFDFHFIKPVRMKEVCKIVQDRLDGNDQNSNSRWTLAR